VQAAENTTTQQNVFEKNIVGPEISVCVPSELSGNILAENSMALSSNPTIQGRILELVGLSF